MTRTRAAALVVALLAATGGVADLGLQLADGAGAELLRQNQTGGDVVAIGYGLAGAYIAWHRPRNPVGWVLLTVALLQGVAGAGNGYAAWSDPLPGRTFAAWVASWVWFPGFALLPTVLVALYPSGRAGRWRRRLVAASASGALLVGLCLALADGAVDDIVPGLENPVAVPWLSAGLGIVGGLLLLACVLLTLADAGRRLWRGRSPEREQLAWLLMTVVIAVGCSYLPVGSAGLAVHVLVPIGIVVGVVRYQLLDLRVVVRRTLVFALLTTAVVLAFAGTTALLGPLVGRGSLPLAVAAALVAVGLNPVRDLLQRAVDRLVYGERRDPVGAVARLGRGVAESIAAEQVLAAVATAVRSPHVVLLATDGGQVCATGTAAEGEPARLPLVVGGAPVGELVVAPRTPRDAWSGDDRALLQLLAQQVAVVVHAAALNAELADSRDRLVRATADERHRLHQELHDGLGPALSGIALGLEAAEAALVGAPERTAQLLARLRAETQGAGREVRRLVEGLRPAALDRQGLGPALTSFVGGLQHAAAGRLALRLDLPPELPPIDPQTDAAVYRIVSEAVTNVVRHSGASTCRITLSVNGTELRLVVEDDGHGLPAQPRDGVGLGSMRSRASALGGSWSVGPAPGGGTRVEVLLPLSAEVPV